ncbi:MAG TPA: lysozyme inhibitor LprI family protein [Allosphingosinicella sp.]|nr:lysozyme inhibitor LprI family protein [Allosphingosinicella sp.]
MIAMFHAALALLAAPLSPSEEWHCDNPQAQMEMNACAAIDFERADAQLNAEYRRAIASARDADREFDGAGDRRPGDEATLREAQRAWVAFRDAQCRLEGYEARGGSMEPMLYEGCRARLTRERIRQLNPEPLGR